MSYLFFLLPGMLLMMWAQFHIKGTYAKYARVESSLGMTGAEVAETILKEMGIHNVTVEPIAGELTDHYDPTAKAVRLSEVVYASSHALRLINELGIFQGDENRAAKKVLNAAALTYVATTLYICGTAISPIAIVSSRLNRENYQPKQSISNTPSPPREQESYYFRKPRTRCLS